MDDGEDYEAFSQLPQVDRAVISCANTVATTPAADRDRLIRRRTGLSATRFYQVAVRLADDPSPQATACCSRQLAVLRTMVDRARHSRRVLEERAPERRYRFAVPTDDVPTGDLL
ncbi:DUF3263 domain-containing protein [Kitasatospora sp. NPDC056076]|uniref:DUF3263 domain-containing protein n=1 Tax=Kitasatospora sp. NPDC056076 TaxID=3345703 RepID=UPI0035D555B8